MEQSFKKNVSYHKLFDSYQMSPNTYDYSYSKTSQKKSLPKQKHSKLYTQTSTSRINNKLSISIQQSPQKNKKEKLMKTSILNFLHKCRS